MMIEGLAKVIAMPAEPIYAEDALAKGGGVDGEMSVNFKNLLDKDLELFWDGNGDLVSMGPLSASGKRTFNSYVDHKWVVKHNDQIVQRLTIVEGQLTYDVNGKQENKDEL
jgi:hypothetical protein